MLLPSQIGKICLSTCWIQFREDYYHHQIISDSAWFVCHGLAKHNQSRHKSRSEPPMLLFFNAKEDAWSLYDVLDNKVLDLQLTLPKKRFCGSAYGWLVLAEEDFSVTLVKPFPKSRDREGRENLVIPLPQLNPPAAISRERFENCDYYVLKATITADPIVNADECIVFVIVTQQAQIAFIRPAKDTTWSYLSTRDRIADVFQWEDKKFYALGLHANLLMFDIMSESKPVVKSFECGMPPNTCVRKYLVGSYGKDLWMVGRDCDWERYPGKSRTRFAREFKVYQFDFDRCLWMEKETLGDDVALFIGENISICVVASNFPGCKQNCIYYNHDYDMIREVDILNDFGVYDMEKKSYSKPYSKHVMTLLEMIDHRPIWFAPTFML